MNEGITIGVDRAENVFQVHGVDGEDGVVFRRRLRRGRPQRAGAVAQRHRGWRGQDGKAL